MIEYQVDGKPPKRVDLFTRWSGKLHLPWLYVLEAELEKGEHRLVLHTVSEKNPASRGHAVRIVQFAANDAEK